MFAQPTLIVVGAGASCEFGFPLGAELRDKLRTRLDFRLNRDHSKITGDGEIYQLLHLDRAAMTAARALTGNIALVDSIDDFIDTHSTDTAKTLCAKLAIARAISSSEKESSLYYSAASERQTINWSAVQNTWLMRLFRLMRVGVNKSQPQRMFENVAFLSFNYDRSLEHFLFHATRDLFEIGSEEAASIVGAVPILHPYGVFAPLPWMPRSDGTTAIPYGEPLSGHLLHDATRNLRTYSESTAAEVSAKIREQMHSARLVVFLGCAYHRQNLELMKVITTVPKRIFGTAFALSEADRGLLSRHRIPWMFDGSPTQVAIEPHLADLKCDDFVRQYGNTIMGS